MQCRAAIVVLSLIPLIGCTSGPGPGERTVFHNPFAGIGLGFPTPATTEHPRYVVCNDDRCGYLDKDGRWTQMSDDERRSYRQGIRLSQENRDFNEQQQAPAPKPPEYPLPTDRTASEQKPN